MALTKNKKKEIGIIFGIVVVAIVAIIAVRLGGSYSNDNSYTSSSPASDSSIASKIMQKTGQLPKSDTDSSSSNSEASNTPPGLPNPPPNPPFKTDTAPIKVSDGNNNIVWCSVFGFAPTGLMANAGEIYFRYQGADNCQEVHTWQMKHFPGGGSGPSIAGHYPGYDPNRDAGYGGAGVGSAGDIHTPYRSYGVDAMTGKPSR